MHMMIGPRLPRPASGRPLITTAILLAFGYATPALADCNLLPTASDDNYLCDSGTHPQASTIPKMPRCLPWRILRLPPSTPISGM